MEDCEQKIGNIFDQSGITIPCSTTLFLEVRPRISLKVATKGSLRGREAQKFNSFRLFFSSKNGEV